jgi:hypothetical protein
MNCADDYYHRAIVRMGESHRAAALSGQDHAVALACDEGIVLAVADGVSIVGGEHSRAEAGAWIIAELAAAGALAALKRGSVEPAAVKVEAATAIAAGLWPLWRTLGTRAKAGLVSTLVLMVVTPRWTHAWASGDGYWGIVLPAGSARHERVVGESLAAKLMGGHQWIGGARHVSHLGLLASTAPARRDDEVSARLAVLDQLRAVLSCSAPVLGAYVATDGLRHEKQLAELLLSPANSPESIFGAIQRPADCDDLGVALAAERFPGMVEVSNG